jgi:predicted negative regulator of RcsB-dependent stress response
MATLESDERNIIEADEVNWRLIVYPILAVAIVVIGGFGIYSYQLHQREEAEMQARVALEAAKTPEDMAKVADDYPRTTQAAIALMKAADASFTAKDYPGALKDYQRVTGAAETPADLRESAQLGLASVQEASGKSEDAIQSYLEIARKGGNSAFAPAAYYQAARICESQKNTSAERQILQEAVRLGGDSLFVKEAQSMLKTLQAAPAAAATNAAPAS